MRLALAISRGDIEASSLKTVLAGLGCCVPEFVARTYVAFATVEEGKIGWAGIAFLCVEVVGLTCGTLVASQR